MVPAVVQEVVQVERKPTGSLDGFVIPRKVAPRKSTSTRKVSTGSYSRFREPEMAIPSGDDSVGKEHAEDQELSSDNESDRSPAKTHNGKKLSDQQMREARKKAVANREVAQKHHSAKLQRNPSRNPKYTDGAASDFHQSDHPEFGRDSDDIYERVEKAVKKRLAPGGGGSAFGYETPSEKYADERAAVVESRLKWVRPCPPDLTYLVDQTVNSEMLNRVIDDWDKMCSASGDATKNGEFRIPASSVDGPDGPISDDELWVGAHTQPVSSTGSRGKPVKGFNIMFWYVDQVKRLCHEMYDASPSGRAQSRGKACLSYVFYTFKPGMNCLLCACGYDESQPYKRKWEDIGRFARHLMEWHVQKSWFFQCRNKKPGVFCTHNGVQMRAGFRTNRLRLFLRNRVQATEHRCTTYEHPRV